MFFKDDKYFVWNAITLQNVEVTGIIKSKTRNKAKQQLYQGGVFQIKLKQVPPTLHKNPIKNNILIELLNAIILLLTSGLPLIETLNLIQKENRSILQRFICCRLIESLQKGYSLAESFTKLDPLFPPFFLSMIKISQQTGRLLDGLKATLEFYEKKEVRQQELRQILRYPAIVLGSTVILVGVVVIFIIPMFDNIYSLFGNRLPIITKFMVGLSSLIHDNFPVVTISSLLLLIWFVVPSFHTFNPLVILAKRIHRVINALDDAFVYSLSMSMQLENGQPLIEAGKNATACMTRKNRKFGNQITKWLESGQTVTQSFRKSRWFPSIFDQMLVSTEKAGKLSVGFFQVAKILEQKKSQRFAFWSRFLEPILMVILGAVILTILLGIYLPIFDLGNVIS